MFLNKYGIPLFGKLSYENNTSEDLRHAPLLLRDSSEIMHCKVPPDWDGCLHASAAILKQIKKDLDLQLPQLIDTSELAENVPTRVKLSGNVESKVEITMLSGSDKCDNASMFLIRDEYTIRLLTKGLTNGWDVFLFNRCLREAITKGVDVLYVDDTVFLEHEQTIPVDVVYPTEFELLALMYLVRPKEVVGTSGSELPEHILKLCHSVNLCSAIDLQILNAF